MQENSKTDETIEEVYNFEKADFTFVPTGPHSYRQQGYYLVCRSCELSHAVFIGKDQVMVGEEDGQPIIKKRKEVGLA